MSTLKRWLTYPFATVFLLLLPFFPDLSKLVFLDKGGTRAQFHALASLFSVTDVPPDGARTQNTLDHAHRSTLKSVAPHRSGFLSLGEKLSSFNKSATGSGAATTIQCTIQFEDSVSRPPAVTVGPAPERAGPFLTILRDTHTEANGWIHGYQKGVQPDSTVRFGASSKGDGEYVEVHPPSGEHKYQLLIFDKDYALGPRMYSLIGTPWHNGERALGSEEAVLDDVRKGNPQSSPAIIGRCSTTVSHEQVASAQEM